MNKCYKCANEIKDEAEFCNKCGANQAEASEGTTRTLENAQKMTEVATNITTPVT